MQRAGTVQHVHGARCVPGMLYARRGEYCVCVWDATACTFHTAVQGFDNCSPKGRGNTFWVVVKVFRERSEQNFASKSLSGSKTIRNIRRKIQFGGGGRYSKYPSQKGGKSPFGRRTAKKCSASHATTYPDCPIESSGRSLSVCLIELDIQTNLLPRE